MLYRTQFMVMPLAFLAITSIAAAQRGGVSGVHRDHLPVSSPPIGPRPLVNGLDVSLGGTREPAIAVNPLNPLNIAISSLWEYRVSTDGGSTWTIPFDNGIPLAPLGYISSGDPSLAFDGAGSLFYSYLGEQIAPPHGLDVFVSRLDSTTGALLSGPVRVSTSGTTGSENDKDWIAADRWPSSPFAGRLYVVWTEFMTATTTRVLISSSSNQGATWSTPLELSGLGEGFVWPAHVAVSPNGDVYVGYHSQTGWSVDNPNGTTGRVYVARSTDGGASFTQKTTAFAPGAADITFNVQSSPGCIPNTSFWLQGSTQAWVLPDPGIAGNVYVVAADDPDNAHGSGDDANIMIARSTDYGVTWSPPSRVDHGPGAFFAVMPTAAIDDQTGRIVVMWYDNRQGVQVNGKWQLDVFYAISDDHGVSFGPDIQINDLSFNPDLNAPQRYAGPPPTLRIGEYIGISSAANSLYGVWCGNSAAGLQQTVCDSVPNAGGQAGSVLAWGRNTDGQCNVPTPPAGVSFVQVAAGAWHTVALLSDGSVLAWGNNGDGQCNVPAPPTGVWYVEVAAGDSHTLARRSDGDVVAWGYNSHGQCIVPALPSGLTYVEIAGGDAHSVARRSDGSIVAWGQNGDGQCNVPALPVGLQYSEIAAGGPHTVARRSDGSVVAWGHGTSAGDECDVPAPPPGLTYTHVAAGYYHTILLRSDGVIVVCGGTTDLHAIPSLPPGVSYVDVAAGAWHNIARRTDGEANAWGATSDGQCIVPVLPSGFSYMEMAGGRWHTVARSAPTNDIDSDAIPNSTDNCQAVFNPTQSNADGDAFGDACDTCTDTDGDGAGDPGYPNNTCPLDACPNDPAKTAPGQCGCGVPDTDTDGDGTADCNDGCPSDPFRIVPGLCGCGVPDSDSDGDGTPDCTDRCPADPLKISPGQCGCGALDTDSDGDGTADCIDGCPNDASKIAPGPCGCGVPETDSDGDGSPNCIDGCPNDPEKTTPGQCGCGVSDTDLDGDGIPGCVDNCAAVANPNQADSDGDGIGDACEGTAFTDRVSVSSAWAQVSLASSESAISADARFVAFTSSAADLVANDTNGKDDIFVHDRHTGVIERVSVDSSGAEGHAASGSASISADGRFVAFESFAADLVAGDTNGFLDVFVHDRQSGTTERVSVATSGTQGDGRSSSPSISADGRFVAFYSAAKTLTADTNNVRDVFVRDRLNGTTELVSVDSSGSQGNSHSIDPSISANGRFVAFTSSATNLVAGGGNGFDQVFVRDRDLGTTERASIATGGAEGTKNSGNPSISADGQIVAFDSVATNLVGNDTNDCADVFLHDRQSGLTERVSVSSGAAQGDLASNWPSISFDGRVVVFHSAATNLVVGDTNGSLDIFVHNHQRGTTERASVATGGSEGILDSKAPSLSADGRVVAFESLAPNLVTGDTNAVSDVFAHDLAGCQGTWQPLFAGSAGVDGAVTALAVYNDGTGPALYAGGEFLNAGGVPASHIAKWNGTSWSPLGGGLSGGGVNVLAVLDDGSGPALYAGGSFSSAGGASANFVARWNGSTWSSLGVGTGSPVRALAVFDDGSGPAFFAGGAYLQKWDGAAWTYIYTGTVYVSDIVALVAHDDGNGRALFVGGGGLVPQVWRWDGVQWPTIPLPFGEVVAALGTYDDGYGEALYVSSADFTPLPYGIVRWAPAGWSLLGAGLAGTNSLDYYSVRAMQVFDDGSGSALYVGGHFARAGGAPANMIASWNGSNWSALGSGLDADVTAVAVFDDGSGPALFAGGYFGSAGGLPSNHVAKWALPSGCLPTSATMCEPGLDGVTQCPCSNPPAGSDRGCNNKEATGGASISGSGLNSLANPTLVFTTAGENSTVGSVLIQGTVPNAGIAFGHGVRCVAGAVKRLYVKLAAAGSITVPAFPNDANIPTRSAALGNPILAGQKRWYQVYYRDTTLLLPGCPVPSNQFNVTNAAEVTWLP